MKKQIILFIVLVGPLSLLIGSIISSTVTNPLLIAFVLNQNPFAHSITVTAHNEQQYALYKSFSSVLTTIAVVSSFLVIQLIMWHKATWPTKAKIIASVFSLISLPLIMFFIVLTMFVIWFFNCLFFGGAGCVL